jgi:hypothetical protein
LGQLAIDDFLEVGLRPRATEKTGGPSARISKVTAPLQVTTVIDGLPSGKSSLPSGDTLGVADVAFIGNNLYALLAGGGCSHGNPDTPNGIILVDVDHQSFSYVANLSAFQMANPIANPGPSLGDWEPDGSWYTIRRVDAVASGPSNNLDSCARNTESNECLNDSNCPATKTRSVRRVDTTDAFCYAEC